MTRIRTAEEHRAYTDLIDQIAVTAETDDVAFRRIRVRAGEIREWFSDTTGWPLVVARDVIRVMKTSARPTSAQGFAWATNPLDYELYTWILWFEEQRESTQFVASELVREIEAQIALTVGPDHFSWDRFEHRISLERAVDALVATGAIRRLDGSIGDYARDSGRDALYEFTGVARHLHIDLPREIEAATAEGDFSFFAVGNPAVPPLQRLYRSLILAPVLYPHHDREAFELLESRATRRTVAEELKNRLGWDLEVTESYACLLRPAGRGQSTNGFPRTNASILHVVLLLCTQVRILVQRGDLIPDYADRVTMTRPAYLAMLLDLRAEFGGNWGKGLSETECSIDRLAAIALDECREWSIAEVTSEDDIRFMPIMARWTATYSNEAIASDEPDEDYAD